MKQCYWYGYGMLLLCLVAASSAQATLLGTEIFGYLTKPDSDFTTGWLGESQVVSDPGVEFSFGGTLLSSVYADFSDSAVELGASTTLVANLTDGDYDLAWTFFLLDPLLMFSNVTATGDNFPISTEFVGYNQDRSGIQFLLPKQELPWFSEFSATYALEVTSRPSTDDPGNSDGSGSSGGSAGGDPTVIPTPATLTLMLLGGMGLLRSQRTTITA